MHTIKYKNQEYIFPEGEECLPFNEIGIGEEIQNGWPDNSFLIRLSGCHIGPPIEVWIMGIYEDWDADETGSYRYWQYKGLRWPDETWLDAEAGQWIGDFYETEIMELIKPGD